jgi:NCS1 family nucleobase:cation symporter-1
LKGVPLEKLAQPDVLIGHLTSSSAPEGLAQPLIASAGVRTAVAIISVLGIVLATVSVNIAANVVSPANDFANVAPKYISFKTGGLITGVLGILCMPWRLMNEMMGWLDGVGALLGPVAAIMIVDYFVVRKKQLNVADLYRPGGRYAGWNPIAVVALLVGIAPNFPGFLHYVKVVSHVPSVFTAIYGYAWFVGFALAAVTYVVGCRIRPVKV